MLCNRIRPKLLLRLRIKKRDYIRNYMAAMDVHPITGQLMSTEEKDAVSRHLRYVETGDIRQWTVEGDLSTELRDARSRFLRDVETGDARQWTVVMGNESGDLDSIASSLAYWWFLHTPLKNDKVIPLIQTPRNDMKLRPENELALSLVSLDAAHEDLLCIDDIPSGKPFPADKFALVDHNRLLSKFSDDNPEASVVAIIDHHEDEQLYLEANPRIVRTPVGSASSLVNQYIKENSGKGLFVPHEVKTLLFCAILIDTGGLKPEGKAEDVDRVSASLLYTTGTFVDGVLSTLEEAFRNSHPRTMHENPTLQYIFRDLDERKNHVLHLDASDLLKRDYKQYQWDLPHMKVTSGPSLVDGHQITKVNVGLSTVPLGLQYWLPRTGSSAFFDTVLGYMSKLGLDVLGILTSFHEDKLSKDHRKWDEHMGKGKGKHKRQFMLFIRSPEDRSTQTPELAQNVSSSLKFSDSAKVLDLEEEPALKYFNGEDSSPGEWISDSGKGGFTVVDGRRLDVHLFKQRNAKATRKIVAPLLKDIIEGGGKSES